MNKRLTRFDLYSVAALLLLIILIFVSSCSDEKSGPTDPRTARFNDLKGEWTIQSVTLDGAALEGYEDFILQLSKTSTPFMYEYQCSNRPSLSPWRDGGTWQFGNNIEQTLFRDKQTEDELQIEYTLTDDQLIIEFAFTGEGYNSRVSSTNGNWVFTLNKQVLFRN